jgi:hypothetical protein
LLEQNISRKIHNTLILKVVIYPHPIALSTLLVTSFNREATGKHIN